MKSHQTKLHRHYGIELVWSREGSFDLSTEHVHYTGINAAIIPSNLPHRFQCSDARCQLLFLDPLSPLGQHIAKCYQLYQAEEILVNPPGVEDIFCNRKPILPSAPAHREEASIDYRIRNCIQEIQTNISCSALSITQLSDISYLSESRLSHLFKEELGISIRQFVLWKKIQLAVSKSTDGHSLSTSAHYAGFSDSSHFTKVFSAMFGSSPFCALKR